MSYKVLSLRGFLPSIEDLIKEITAHNLRVFIEGQRH